MQKKEIWMIMILLFSAFVFAEEETSAGMTPDNFLWGLDVAFDKLSVGMTFDKEKKIEKELRVAEERLQEVREMIRQNKLDKSEKAEKEHLKMLETAEIDLDKVKDKDDVKQFEKELRLEQKILEHKERALKVKLEIEGNLTDEQQVALETFLATLEGNVNKLEVKIKNKGDETRIRVKTELGEEKVEELEKSNWKWKAENEQKQAEKEILKAEEKIKRFIEKETKQESDDEDDKKEKSSNSGKSKLTVTGQVTGSSKDNDDQEGKDESEEETEIEDEVEDETDDDTDEDLDDEAEDELDDETEGKSEDDSEDKGEDESEEETEDDLEDDSEEETETEEEYESEVEGNVLTEFNLTLPVYQERTVNSSLKYVADAKSALQESKESYAKEEFKAAYAYAKYAKKLAQRAMSGKYLSSIEEEEENDDSEDESVDEESESEESDENSEEE